MLHGIVENKKVAVIQHPAMKEDAVAALNDRRSIIKNSTNYLAASIAGQGFGIIRAVLLPVLFKPAQLGIWSLMNVVVNYGANSHLGALHGMNKAIPVLRGQGKSRDAELMKDSIFWVNLLLAAVVATGVGVASAFVSANYVMSLRIVAIIIFLQSIFYYLFSLLRADSRFGLLSKGVGGLSILTTAFVLAFAFGFANHLIGALLGVSVAYLAIIIYWLFKGHYRFAIRWRLEAIREAFILGIPLIILTAFDSVVLSVDRWVIAAHSGETKLGYYALGLMPGNLLGMVATSVASVLYPKMLERFAIEKDPALARNFLLGPVRALTAIILILICSAAVGLPLFIRLFIPKYLPSIPVMEVLILGAFFPAASAIPCSYLIAINKQNWLIAIQIVTALFILVTDTIMLREGYGILGAAIGTVIGYGISSLSYTVLSVHLALGRRVKAAHFCGRLLLPFGVMALAMLAANTLILDGATLGTKISAMLGRLGVVMTLLVGTLWLVNRDGKVVAEIRAELLARFPIPKHPT
jgi:O-antigen/teichoic acid export membrane protein